MQTALGSSPVPKTKRTEVLQSKELEFKGATRRAKSKVSLNMFELFSLLFYRCLYISWNVNYFFQGIISDLEKQ